ncbi:MAG: filamentous hemagglutinin N-terminal domain-containing protein, partial [Betaproteobacteria bacterium]|nr:filamentous hemagglutinin N-terminal domain-containing protein [Betaproteobacteria bacterium]
MNQPLRHPQKAACNPAAEGTQHPPLRKAIAWVTLWAFIFQPLAATAQVIADPAAGANRPQVGTTLSGVPIVQIVAPSAAGVSHNQYQQFNVDPQGLILNNSTGVTSTQLGGFVEGNANLTGGSARIILNEVTSANPSALLGYIEVAGSKAEVVIANPNGITCNGCGFINTTRGVLVTGTPMFGGSGSLDAFRVTGGSIAISGAGLNSSSTDQIDLIARSIQVNGDIWAKNLNIVAGANQVNYSDLGVQLIQSDANIPTVGIDVALLGGMYANKIHLVGTEAGVGVVNAGNIAAQAGDLVIDNQGRVTLTGNTNATANLTINAGAEFSNSGILYAGADARIDTQGQAGNTGTLAAKGNLDLTANSVNSTGTLGAGVNADGTLGTSGNLSINATAVLAANGQNLAGGNIALTGGSLDLTGAATSANGNATLTATAGDIDHRNGTLYAGGAIALGNTGALRNDNGAFYAEGNLNLQSTGALSNQGGLIHAGADLAITAQGALDNTDGSIETTGTANTATVSAASIDNRNGRIVDSGSGQLTVNAGSRLQNGNAGGQSGMGTIGGNGDVTIAATQIDNNQGARIVAGGNLLLGNSQGDSSRIDNGSGTLYAGGNLTIDQANAAIGNAQGNIIAAGQINLHGNSLDNTQGKIGNLAGSGSGITINLAGSIVNTGGEINSDQNLALTAAGITGAGTIAAGNDAALTLTGPYTSATGSLLSANHDFTLGVTGGFTNQGTLTALNKVTVTAGQIDNQASGLINAQTTALNATTSLANAGRIEGTTLSTNSATLTNTGTFIGDSLSLTAATLDNQGAAALIAATGNIDLNVSGNFSNTGGATVYSLGDIVISGAASRDANGLPTVRAAQVLNESSTIEAGGNLAIAATNLINRRTYVNYSSATVGSASAGYYAYGDLWPGLPWGIWPANPAAVSGNDILTYHSLFSYERQRSVTYTAVQQSIVSAAANSIIAASGNIGIDAGTLTNTASTIAAGGNLAVNAGAAVTNTAYSGALTETITTTHGVCYDTNSCGWINTPQVSQRITALPGLDSVLSGGQSVQLQTVNLANTTLAPNGGPSGNAATLGVPAAGATPTASASTALTLPANALYSYHTGPAATYLIETDPRFANYNTFISSDYMLSRLNLDPQLTQKRLGDGFYEQKLIGDQIVAQTGRRFLPGQSDPQAEFKALMDSGLAAAQT